MKKSQLNIDTNGRGLIEVTHQLRQAVAQASVHSGLCHCYIHHTSASLVIMENADPDVLVDLGRFMDDLVPDGDPRYIHTAEGPDDMPAHVKSALTQTSLFIPIEAGQLDLGTWQGVYVWEHRHRAHTRRLTVTIQG